MTIPAAASDNASMLRVANVTARAGALRVRSVTARAGTLRVANIAARTAVLAFVGLITFTSSWPAHTPDVRAQAALQVAAYVISAVLMAAGAAYGWVSQPRR